MGNITTSLGDFSNALSSKSPVPGGGGTSALVGALGSALGSMVGNLTLGKKKYADVQQDIESLLEASEVVRQKLMTLIDEDEKVFSPLADAYSLPSGTDEQKAYKTRVMEEVLHAASEVPLEIMRQCCRAITLHEDYAKKGSAIAISDVGVGVALCKAALEGASLSVFINTKAMTNRDTAKLLEDEADAMLEKYCPLADEIYQIVVKRLR